MVSLVLALALSTLSHAYHRSLTTSLFFSTEGSDLEDTEMGVWDTNGSLLATNDDYQENGWSQIVIEASSLPAVYYVGGSEFQTDFGNNWVMSGDAMDPSETGRIVFSVNNETIGTKVLGDATTTGLTEYALFKVELGASGEIVSVEDVPPQAFSPCSIADFFQKKSCTLDNICDQLKFQLGASSEGEFRCDLNDNAGLSVEFVHATQCYDDATKLGTDETVIVDDLSAIPTGVYCEIITDVDDFDASGVYLGAKLISTLYASGNQEHRFVREFMPVSCNEQKAAGFFQLGDKTFCYATDDCSSVSLNGESCSDTCVVCSDKGDVADCSNIDTSLVQTCGQRTMFAPLVSFLDPDWLPASSPMMPTSSTIVAPTPPASSPVSPSTSQSSHATWKSILAIAYGFV